MVTCFFVYNELFAIGKFIMLLMLHEVVTTMNVIFSKLIPWLVGAKMQVVMHDFK
jgi:hypothetical protein